MSVINGAAMQILNKHARVLYADIRMPDGDAFTVMVTGVGSKVGGHRTDTGELREDIPINCIVAVRVQ